jgi:hypothetical protein
MDQANPLATLMIWRSKTNDDPYQPREEEVVDTFKYLIEGWCFFLFNNPY